MIYARWLADIGIGIGEWIAEKIAVFHKWPLFVNFDRNIVPNFLFDIAAQDRLPANAVFDEDARFVLSGGDYSRIFLKADAGLKEIRSVEKMDVVVEVENGAQKPGSEFFFVVRKKRLEDKVPAPHAYDEHQA